MAEKVTQQIEMDKGNINQATGQHAEAPYSANWKTAEGIQYTIRAMTEAELVGKVESLRGRLNTTTPVPSNGTVKAFCPIHSVEMQERTGKYGKFFSHHDGDGWCNGK